MAAQFSWAAGADVAGGVASAISAWGAASSNKIVAKANAEAQRVVRDAQNVQRASGLSLAATMRGISYRAALSNAGSEDENAAVLMARSREAWTSHNFEQHLKNVEQTGALAARSAAAGVGGASIRAVSYSQTLQQQRMQQHELERQDQTSYEMVKQRTGIMPAAVSRLDISPLNPNLDYSSSFVQPTAGNGNLLTALMEGVLSKNKSLQVALDSIPRGNGLDVNAGIKGEDLSLAYADYGYVAPSNGITID